MPRIEFCVGEKRRSVGSLEVSEASTARVVGVFRKEHASSRPDRTIRRALRRVDMHHILAVDTNSMWSEYSYYSCGRRGQPSIAQFVLRRPLLLLTFLSFHENQSLYITKRDMEVLGLARNS
jgi:hypothetical protein